jgi:formylglycine-generating enzyme required for sulfatase activity
VGAGEQLPGPVNPAKETVVAQWRHALDVWKTAIKKEVNYSDTLAESYYGSPSLKWTQTSFIQPQMHPFDRYFFDPQTGKYTVDRFLRDLRDRYGGVDSILLWPTYTNIGTDDRSQFDLYEALPGGLPALKDAVSELHAAGVKVLLAYNPWDGGTARCAGPGNGTCVGCSTADDSCIMTHLLNAIGADGINGDTMNSVGQSFGDYEGSPGRFAIEPEDQGEYASLQWTTMGWGYYYYPYIPEVDSWKWLEHRHMTNICERWSKNHNDALQYAFFNSAGFESWESVWGNFNRITPRDGEAIRRVATMLRFLGKRGYTVSPHWEPHSPTLAPNKLFAGFWPAVDSSSYAWTIVNRNRTSTNVGPAVNVSQAISGDWSKLNFFDLYHGNLICKAGSCGDGVIALTVEAAGFGSLLGTTQTADSDEELGKLLNTMRNLSSIPLSSISRTWQYTKGERLPTAVAEAPSSVENMVRIPGGAYRFAVTGIEIEDGGDQYWPTEELEGTTIAGNAWTQRVWPHPACGDGSKPCGYRIGEVKYNPTQVDVQYEWEPRPSRFHAQYIHLKPFLIDRFPVTQQNFSRYLQATGGVEALPADRFRFLKNWDWSSAMPVPLQGNAKLPVTYVGVDEARAYCEHFGKRLPREEEWQFSGQSGDSERLYPWADQHANASAMMPKFQIGHSFAGPEPVDAHSPASDSVFGVADLVGNVHQMTDEYVDAHTRNIVLRGGSNYKPDGSSWYFPNIPDLKTHNKYNLMGPRYERAGPRAPTDPEMY